MWKKLNESTRSVIIAISIGIAISALILCIITVIENINRKSDMDILALESNGVHVIPFECTTVMYYHDKDNKISNKEATIFKSLTDDGEFTIVYSGQK